jgi:glycosyltransferase involved in cell wall biosynthesis
LKIAVGICTKDIEDTIEETLTSIVRQERSPDRIIICDKSNDKTLDIVKNLSRKYAAPMHILHQKGDGVGDAYQQMYENLEEDTDALATLQTNLVVDSDWLEKIEQGFEDNPWADLVVPSFTSGQEGPYSERLGGKRGYLTGRNMAITVDALRRVNGWDSSFLRGEDWDLNIRLWKAGVRCVAIRGIEHRWIRNESMDVLKKAKRKPTSLTFLAKYGLWYLRFRPVHVLGDLCSALLVALFMLLPGTISIYLVFHNLLPLGMNLIMALFGVTSYVGTYVIFYKREMSMSSLVKIMKHAILNGLAFFSALYRLVSRDYKWNMMGFRNTGY